jgi:hypothetical protein
MRSHHAVVSALALLVLAAPAVAVAPPQRWPAYVNGKFVSKTFRFRPAAIEYRPLPTRGGNTMVIFRIKEKDIPADHFAVSRAGRLVGPTRERVRKILAEDDGYITVRAYWVNRAVPKAEWGGSPEWWVEGRALLGRWETNPSKGRDRDPSR